MSLVRRFAAIVLTVVAMTTHGAHAADVPADLKALQDRASEFAEGFSVPIRACVANRDTSHHMFHGCIDWHSSTHGNWALTAAARVIGREDLAKFVKAGLSVEGIALERRYMNARPSFEMPYGRAWFLRLAIEFERAFDDQRLRKMADDMAQSLVAYLSAVPAKPLSSSYGSQSWALVNLRAYGAHTGEAKYVAFVDDMVKAHYLNFRDPCPTDLDVRRRSFMAVCTNYAWLVSETMDTEDFKVWLEKFLPEPERIKPVTRPANAHVYGLNFSRAWGLWRLYKRTGDERYLKLYRAHLEPTFDKPSWWRGDYRIVGHWVGQFGMFAIMPLFEPDYF